MQATNSVLTDLHWKDSLPEPSTVQKALLGLTVVCGIISLVPPLRIAGALALRSVSLLSSVVACTDNDRSFSACAMRSARIGIVSLGIAALVLASPLLMKISLIVDGFLQAAEALKALQAEDPWKALMHVGIMIIDVLVIAAIGAGSWQLMVAAASLGIVLMIYMIALTAKRTDCDPCFEGWCYFALAVLGVAGACSVARLPKALPEKKVHFSYKNTKDYDVEITVEPASKYTGEGGSAYLRPGETFDRSFNHSSEIMNVKHNISLNLDGDVQVISKVRAVDVSWEHFIRHGPLPPSLHTTIPAPMGPAMVTKAVVEKEVD